jgi:DNA polymerase sigma
MQEEILGFVPNRKPLEQVVTNSKSSSMDKEAVETFNLLSSAMGQLYQNVYIVTERIHQQREMVRSHIESIVSRCGAFPSGTRVVVFGSSANGFG